MDIAEFEDAKLLWKMFYAYQCFRRAEAATQHILDERLEQESALFYPPLERIWRIFIENRRSDQAALDTIAILDSVNANGSITKPDRTFLKWAGQQAYQKTIFPQDYGEIDAFAIRANEPGVFLHSANDLHPRQRIITNPGSYDLKYLLYAHGFPPTHFTVALHYQGPEGSTASLT
jgi:hypothetical protein